MVKATARAGEGSSVSSAPFSCKQSEVFAHAAGGLKHLIRLALYFISA